MPNSEFHSLPHGPPLLKKPVSGLRLLLLQGIFLLGTTCGVGTAFAQNLYVGSNSSGQTTNFTSGTNSYGYTYVGFSNSASNNLLTVGGSSTVLTNSSDLFVGYAGSGNSMVISNGGKVSDSNGSIGFTNGSTNNSVTVNSGSLWTNRGSLVVGYFVKRVSQQILTVFRHFFQAGILDQSGGLRVSRRRTCWLTFAPLWRPSSSAILPFVDL